MDHANPDIDALRASCTTWMEVYLSSFGANVRAVLSEVRPAKLMAVIKGNGFGLGAARLAGEATKSGADWLAVSSVTEGIALRDAGVTAPVLVLGPMTPLQIREGMVADLALTITDLPSVQLVEKVAHASRRTARVHWQIDTGLRRFGATDDEVGGVIGALSNADSIVLEGTYTHLAVSIRDNTHRAIRQRLSFLEVLEQCTGSGLNSGLRHVASTGALVTLPETYFDMVRVGSFLYGIQSAGQARALSARPVWSLQSRVVRIETVPADTYIGYGDVFRTERVTRVATIPIGYGDGLAHGLSNTGYVLIRGRRAPVIGALAMDYMTVDVTDVPEAEVDDVTVLVGSQGSESIQVNDFANLSGIPFPQQVSTVIADRVPRMYY